MSAATPPAQKVDLAREPDFRLGELHVSPSAVRVRLNGVDERLEPRVMQVLVALARAGGGTVTRDQLVESCWEGRIVSDDAISRIIAKVRGLAREAEPPPFTVETIPKVGFRLRVGEVGGAPSHRPGSEQAPTRRHRWLVAALGLVLAVAAGLVLWSIARPAGQPAAPDLIEVMAFESRQADPDLRRLARTTGETLVRIMSSAGMPVAPAVGSPGAGEGAAAFRLTGAFDREGDDYVASAQFIDRASGVVLWSVRGTRAAAGAEGFEEEVALAIAGPLQCAIEDRRRFKRPMAPGVFTLYLNACDALAREGNPERMMGATRRLVEAAPGEPTAHAMFAIAQAQVAGLMDFASDSEVEAMRRAARASAERAIRLGSDTPKAYLALGISYPAGAAWDVRERNLLRAQQIDPAMGPVRLPLVAMLREVGRLAEARQLAIRAQQLSDPRIAGGMSAVDALLAAQTGDLDTARAAAESVGRRRPEAGAGIEQTIALWLEPDIDRAREALRGPPGAGFDPGSLACGLAHLDRLAARRPGLAPECAAAPTDWRVRMLARQGDIDGAYAAYARQPPAARGATLFLFYPEMKAFRADPRFMPLAARLGLVDYWRSTGRWPDFCAEPDLPYDCRAAAGSL